MEPTSPGLPAGLSSQEAARRLALYGPNRTVRRDRAARLREILGTLADPMAVLLLVTACLYFALGEARDAWVILAAVAPVLLVDVLLSARSRNALKKLEAAVEPRARVFRDGREMEVPTADLVPGDLLRLGEGDRVHADGFLKECSNLAVDESLLTGESEPIPKQAWPGQGEKEAAHLFFAGSAVLTGQALGEVSATGARSRLGAIAGLVSRDMDSRTPLQIKISALVQKLILGAALLVAALFLVSLSTGAGWAEAFLSAMSLGMAAIPEEFSLVLAVFLSLGAYRLSRRGVLVKRLAGVETLGSTTVICLDKTGTLTSGEFILDSHLSLEAGRGEDSVLEAALFACEHNPSDTLERSIVQHAERQGMDPGAVERDWELAFDYDFDPRGKHMSHVWRRKDGTHWRLAAKGALEGLLEHCDISPQDRARAEAENAKWAAGGARVLAVAGKEAPGFTGERRLDEKGLRLYGLLVFRDPLRPEVPAAVALCRQAGVKLKLITGDHPLTAHAVAEAAGIFHQPGELVRGDELAALSPEAFARRAREGVVFARIQPEQKYALVEALQQGGEVVAMTGDGINDAPALRRADIGVAMGKRGTEVARSAADLVLLEDRFSALVDGIREGRRIFDNLRSAFLFLISFKTPVLILAFICPLLGFPLLLLPVHLVWFEMIVHPVSALVFEGQGARPDTLRRPPRPPQEPILPPGETLRSLLSGMLLALLVLAVYLRHLDQGLVYARSTALATQVLGCLLLILAARAGNRAWWKVPLPHTQRFWWVVGSALLSLPVFFEVRALADLFRVQPIQLHDWALALGLALLAVGWRAFGFPPGEARSGA